MQEMSRHVYVQSLRCRILVAEALVAHDAFINSVLAKQRNTAQGSAQPFTHAAFDSDSIKSLIRQRAHGNELWRDK